MLLIKIIQDEASEKRFKIITGEKCKTESVRCGEKKMLGSDDDTDR